MSNIKGGFSTLNRWLGKKNKDKSGTPNGKLSKSSTNLTSLSVSSTDINETSQLEYNRITPLPAATSNAPFEQTFRITVLLPKDQLYVTRLGARVPLSKLLELVCENKQLDAQKYEFRNPVDPSQVYGCELTIGAVGLSEMRLCHKSDSYDTFNADEVIKLHRTAGIRDSLSSSEFSSRNSKHTTKTASPYSSSNSLNSMDSTGMNYTRTPVTAPPALHSMTPPKMTAPPRKKRAAPRPPAQSVIPERAPLPSIPTTAMSSDTHDVGKLKKEDGPLQPLPRKDFFVSTPNLASSTLLSGATGNSIDCNGNTPLGISSMDSHSNDNDNNNDNEDLSLVETHVEERNARNLSQYRGSVQNLPSMISSPNALAKFPEPSPRKRLIQIKKKSAPAPPPRGSSGYFEDSVSVSSAFADTSEASPPNGNQETPPAPLSRETTAAASDVTTPLQASTPLAPTDAEELEAQEMAPRVEEAGRSPVAAAPTPVPRQITTTLLNASSVSESSAVCPPAGAATAATVATAEVMQPAPNVTKIMLNRTPTPEPRSLSLSEAGEMTERGLNGDDSDNVSKQADSGIGEPVPSPIPDSLQSEGSAQECKSTFESSSDDDDMVRVYNFKLGKTLLQPIEGAPAPLPPTLQDRQATSGESTPATLTPLAPTPNSVETSSWNYAIPISPPPNFADGARPAPDAFADAVVAPISDMPITPKINQRPVLNFEALAKETQPRPLAEQPHAAKPDATPTSPLPSPMDEIMDELSAIISERRIDTLIRRSDEQRAIESAKPNTLSNFSIATISEQSCGSGSASRIPESMVNGHDSSSTDEEKLYRKRGDPTPNSAPAPTTKQLHSPPHKQRLSVARADSFHTTAQQSPTAAIASPAAEDLGGLLSARSASHLSLTKIEPNGLGGLNRRRSSSELSIGESPSLQSLEVIKTILSSRKNSLANSSDSETKPSSAEFINRLEARRTSREDLKVATVELQPQLQLRREDNVDGARERKEQVAQQQPQSLPHPQMQEVSKVYRYSGPPNINFSTWSERPKVQVAIKNEGDYIFGGKNASAHPKTAGAGNAAAARSVFAAIEKSVAPAHNYRASTPAGSLKWEPTRPEDVAAVVAAVPPAVAPKPLNSLNSLNSPMKRMGIPEQEFRVPITVKPLADMTVETREPQANTQAANKPKTAAGSTATATATLPRSGANRFSMPAPAPGPALLRSTSITQLEANRPKSTAAQVADVPFGQNTLRKTGLKEMILARQAADEEKHRSLTTPNTSHTPTTNGHTRVNQRPALVNGHGGAAPSNASSVPKTVQSAKLQLKLHQPSIVFAHSNSSKSTTAMRSPNTPDAPTPTPPPPPVLPTLKPVGRSPSSPSKSPISPDPRDHLLAAIRNFKRNELNRI